MTKLVDELREITHKAAAEASEKRKLAFFKLVDKCIREAASKGEYKIELQCLPSKDDMSQAISYLKKEEFEYTIEGRSSDWYEGKVLCVSWKPLDEKKSWFW